MLPSVSAIQMRRADEIAVQDVGLGILQMMENAGRSLAELAMLAYSGTKGSILVLAGAGGNGGGALLRPAFGQPWPECQCAVELPCESTGRGKAAISTAS